MAASTTIQQPISLTKCGRVLTDVISRAGARLLSSPCHPVGGIFTATASQKQCPLLVSLLRATCACLRP
jgi:hypothetical protein